MVLPTIFLTSGIWYYKGFTITHKILNQNNNFIIDENIRKEVIMFDHDLDYCRDQRGDTSKDRIMIHTIQNQNHNFLKEQSIRQDIIYMLDHDYSNRNRKDNH